MEQKNLEGERNMKHYVLLKFDQKFFSEEILKYTKEVFQNIEKQVESIKSINVFINCIERDTNMDIMIEMDLKNKEALNIYLNHELHKGFVNVVDEYLVSKVSFDCE